jgi:hypothetical protein
LKTCQKLDQPRFDRISLQNTKAGRIQRSQHWIGSHHKTPTPVGYIDHQQPTTGNQRMINQQVSPKNRYWEEKKNPPETQRSFKTGWRQAVHAGST